MIRVYLDTSVYNRPFDDQKQQKIVLETEATLKILTMIIQEQIELVSSSILKYENSRSSRPLQRESIMNFLKTVKIKQPKTTMIELRARELENLGIKAFDALHVASAELVNCDYFID